ncbi:MAG: ArsR/SmtB family transcription factor [Nitrosopumilaceae archaeon]
MKVKLLSALAEPNRLHIVELLRDGPRSVGEICNKLKLHQPQVSKHLHVLSKAGFVEAHPDAQQRIYNLRQQPFQEIDTWLDSYRRFWEKRLDSLDDYLIKLQEDEMKKRGKTHARKK